MDKQICVAAVLWVGLLCSCSTNVTRKLDGRVFDVPKRYDRADSDKPFFLPMLNPDDGFAFTLNPQAALHDQNLISVASKKRICARAAGTKAQVNYTICTTALLSWQGLPLRKVTDGVFWTYDLPATPDHASPRSLANCFAMDEHSGTGLCTASLPYGNLVLTVHLRDNQVSSLQALYDQSVSHLRDWER